MEKTALSLLQSDEICTVVLPDGTQRDAAWNPESQCFDFCDGKGSGLVLPENVLEWWPAGVKF